MGNNERFHIDIKEDAAIYYQFRATDKHINLS
jgi:hypothetical protein